MKVFNNLKDLEQFVGSSAGLETVMNEQALKSVLRKEARRLEGYLKDELQKYFNSYSPIVYERTGDTLASIYVTEPKRVGMGLWNIEIRFSDISYKPSVMGDYPDGFTARLLSTGWDVSGKVGHSTPYFAIHKGTDYIPKAVERFNKSNPHGFRVEIFGLD